MGAGNQSQKSEIEVLVGIQGGTSESGASYRLIKEQLETIAGKMKIDGVKVDINESHLADSISKAIKSALGEVNSLPAVKNGVDIEVGAKVDKKGISDATKQIKKTVESAPVVVDIDNKATAASMKTSLQTILNGITDLRVAVQPVISQEGKQALTNSIKIIFDDISKKVGVIDVSAATTPAKSVASSGGGDTPLSSEMQKADKAADKTKKTLGDVKAELKKAQEYAKTLNEAISKTEKTISDNATAKADIVKTKVYKEAFDAEQTKPEFRDKVPVIKEFYDAQDAIDMAKQDLAEFKAKLEETNKVVLDLESKISKRQKMLEARKNVQDTPAEKETVNETIKETIQKEAKPVPVSVVLDKEETRKNIIADLKDIISKIKPEELPRVALDASVTPVAMSEEEQKKLTAMAEKIDLSKMYNFDPAAIVGEVSEALKKADFKADLDLDIKTQNIQDKITSIVEDIESKLSIDPAMLQQLKQVAEVQSKAIKDTTSRASKLQGKTLKVSAPSEAAYTDVRSLIGFDKDQILSARDRGDMERIQKFFQDIADKKRKLNGFDIAKVAVQTDGANQFAGARISYSKKDTHEAVVELYKMVDAADDAEEASEDMGKAIQKVSLIQTVATNNLETFNKQLDKNSARQKDYVVKYKKSFNDLYNKSIEENAKSKIKEPAHVQDLERSLLKMKRFTALLEDDTQIRDKAFLDKAKFKIESLKNEIDSTITRYKNAEYSTTQLKASDTESNKAIQREGLEKLINDTKKAGIYTGELKKTLDGLSAALEKADNSAGMDLYIDKVRVAKKEVQKLKSIQSEEQLKKAKTDVDIMGIKTSGVAQFTPAIRTLKGDITKALKTTDVDKQFNLWLGIESRIKNINRELKVYNETNRAAGKGLSDKAYVSQQKKLIPLNFDAINQKYNKLSDKGVVDSMYESASSGIFNLENNLKHTANYKERAAVIKELTDRINLLNKAVDNQYRAEAKLRSDNSKNSSFLTSKETALKGIEFGALNNTLRPENNISNEDAVLKVRSEVARIEGLINSYREQGKMLTVEEQAEINTSVKLLREYVGVQRTLEKKSANLNFASDADIKLAIQEFKKLDEIFEQMGAKADEFRAIFDDLTKQNELLFGSKKDAPNAGSEASDSGATKEKIRVTQEQLKEYNKAVNTYKALSADEAKAVKKSNKERELQATTTKKAQAELEKFNAQMKAVNPRAFEEFGDEIDSVRAKLAQIAKEGGSDALREVNADIGALNKRLEAAGFQGGNIFTSIEGKIRSFSHYFLGSAVVFKFFDELRKGVQVVKDLDDALTNINMTMPLTKNTMQQLTTSSINMAKELGMSVKEVMTAAQIYANMNTSVEGILQKARPTALLSTAADMGASEAADLIQGSLYQFEMEQTEENAMRIVDVVEKISASTGVEFARSIREISEGIKTTGSMAKEAGYDIETYSGLVANLVERTRKSGGEVSNAMKMIFARMGQNRGLEGEELASDEEISKAEEALATVQIRLRDTKDSFRDIPDVLDDLGKKWETLTDVQRAGISEALAGNRNRSVFIAMMNNYANQVALTTDALNAQGFAEEANAKRMESFTAKLGQLEATTASVFNNLTDTSLLKNMLDGVIMLVGVLDGGAGKLIAFTTALITLTAAKNAFETSRLGTAFIDTFKGIRGANDYFKGLIASYQEAGGEGVSFGEKMKNTKELMDSLTAGTDATAKGMKAFGSILKSTLITAGLMIAFSLISKVINETSKSIKKLKESVETISGLESGLEDINSKLDETKKRINELKSLGSLTFVEQGELAELEKVNTELERQRIIKEAILEAERGKASKDAVAIASQASETGFGQNVAGPHSRVDFHTVNVTKDQSLIEHINMMKELEVANADLDAQYASQSITRDDYIAQIEANNSAMAEYKAKAAELADELLVLDEGIVGSTDKNKALKDSIKAALDEFVNMSNGAKQASTTLSSKFQDISNMYAPAGYSMGEYFTKLNDALSAKGMDLGLLDTIDLSVLVDIENPEDLDAVIDDLREQLNSAGEAGMSLEAIKHIEDQYNLLIELQTLLGVNGEKSFTKLVGAILRGNMSFRDFINEIMTGKQKAEQASLDSILSGAKLQQAKDEVASSTESMLYLSEVEEQLNDGASLSLEKKDELIAKYPQLKDQIYRTAEGWRVEQKSIQALRKEEAAKTTDSISYMKKELEAKKLKVAQSLNMDKKELQSMSAMRAAFNEQVWAWASAGKGRGQGSSQGVVLPDYLQDKYDGIETIANMTTQIADIEALINEVNSMSTGSLGGGAAPKDKDKDTKDAWLEAFQKELEALKFARAMDKISAQDYYSQLAVLRDKYFTKNGKTIAKYLKEWRQYTEEVYQGGTEVFNERMQNSTNWIGDGAYYKELDTQGQIDSWKRVLVWMKTEFYEKGLINHQTYMENVRTITRTMTDLMREDFEKENEKRKKALTDQQDALQKIIDLTVELIKKETEDKIEGLEKQVEQYKNIINLKKESLQISERERDYQSEVDGKVSDISKLQAQVDLLALDDSREAAAKRAELLDQIAEKQKDLNEFQHDDAVEKTEEALDKQLKDFEDEKEKEIKVLKDYLAKSGQLVQDAMDRIENEGEALFKDLMAWNLKYGDGLEATVTDAWETATEALKEYGSVLSAVATIQNSLKQLDSEDFTSNSDKINAKDEVDSIINPGKDKNVAQNAERNSDIAKMKQNASMWGAADKAERDRLHKENLAIAHKWGFWRDANTGYYYYPDKKTRVFHTGLKQGFAGNKSTLKQDELYALLQSDELIFNKGDQMKLLDKLSTAKSLTDIIQKMDMGMGAVNSFDGSNSISLHVEAPVSISGNVDNDVMAELSKFGDQIANKAINKLNDAFRKNGFGVNPMLGAMKPV